MTIIHGFGSFNTITSAPRIALSLTVTPGVDKGIRANASVGADRASRSSRTSSMPAHFPGYTIIEFAQLVPA